MASLADRTIASLAPDIKKGDLSPVALTEACLARIEEGNAAVNAFVTVDAEGALKAARAVEAEIAGGTYRGPLHGIPIGHKDLYQTKGLRTTAGSQLLMDNIPAEDATTVACYRAAGAVMLGKLNTHEFAYGPTGETSAFGASRNPWDTSRITGGSSGGSGAAVAARLCPAATGSDTGGSIRMPAAACGVTGLKPTYGRVSRAGIYPLCWTMDHAGPLTRSARDAALMLQPIAGVDARDAASADEPVPDYVAALGKGIKGKRIGLPVRHFFSGATEEIEAKVREAAGVLEGLGAHVEEVDIAHAELAAAAALVMYLAEGTAYHDDDIGPNADKYTDQVRLFLELGNYVLAKDYLHAQRFRTLLGHAMADVLERVDFLAMPTLPMTATPIGEPDVTIRGEKRSVFASMLVNTEPFDLTGLPAVVVPCGFGANGMPISMQIVGRPFDEAGILNAADAYQQATDWHEKSVP